AAAFDWVDPVRYSEGQDEVDRLLGKAQQQEVEIVARLRRTAPATRSAFPLWELARAFELVPGLTGAVPPAGPAAPSASRDTVLLDVLLLALLTERFPRYLPALTADGATGLTTGTVLEVLKPDAGPVQARWDAFAPDRPLVANELIELGTTEA